ncbi:hypothetical protein NHP20013_09670 [Helicobacter bizzozeronii]|nr:hypothetical protein NHP20013_09670 [Helicobacter bizzozeronii]
MLSAYDVIAPLRARLKDENFSDLRFSDGELLDNLNKCASALILEFQLNRTQKLKSLTHSSPFLKTPYLLGILEAKFNNTPLRERTCEHKNTGNLALYVQGDTCSVTPFKEGHLSVIYTAYAPLEDIAQSLPLPPIALDALLYGALLALLEVPTEEQNYNKMVFYQNLYKEAKNKLTLYLNRLYSTQTTSKVVRI